MDIQENNLKEHFIYKGHKADENGNIFCFIKPKKERKNKYKEQFKLYKFYILDQTYDKDGYKKLYICGKSIRSNRFIYECFNGEIEEKYQINHINEIKQDNSIINLNKMTPKENINHGTRNERVGEKVKGVKNYKSKKKDYYETNPIVRTQFKRTCKRQEWNFEDFEEIKSNEKYLRSIKYFYKEK